MQFDPPLQHGNLIKRYKRFLADIELDNGEVITIHCPNTGSMKNCQAPGSRIWYSKANNPKRKYPYTWEIVEVDGLNLVGINTGRANRLVVEAINAGTVQQLQGYRQLETEVPYGEQNSRIDILLRGDAITGKLADCYVEVKNVSLGMGKGLGLFPDAVTTRGQKHLQELMSMSAHGYRAVLFFCVQHSGIQWVSPADDIDPEYGRLIRQAASQGVELMAYEAVFDINASTIQLSRELSVVL
ncbi:MAG TPA: DNA/RNA nuclease SfsA [Gammaproteobacteria bacterium]|jgi:sugar fermentation stimulation protein A|nr:DNA/RNA nuclease SfsA [Gammaproteobacteria bacterium]HIF86127.1 DNA/RNA nuclease SfsA [Gammaproteobacteria bacterium]HIL62486.1 DNA/RNA nuclease SfsA [Porticoccaceae bacterium]HIN91088.1 DNA/RNA nuclease SfsA [Porticoccaceae bacterium]